MTAASEIFRLLMLITAVFGSLYVTIQWTRHIADWLWLIVHATKITAAVTVGAVIFTACIIKLIGSVALDGPLAVATELICMPFITIYGANGIAYLNSWKHEGVKPTKSLRNFIFEVCREAQREAYQAPPNHQA